MTPAGSHEQVLGAAAWVRTAEDAAAEARDALAAEVARTVGTEGDGVAVRVAAEVAGLADEEVARLARDYQVRRLRMARYWGGRRRERDETA